MIDIVFFSVVFEMTNKLFIACIVHFHSLKKVCIVLKKKLALMYNDFFYPCE